MYAQSKRHFARKNLFLIEIGALIEGKDNFNIFATECDYSPYQITGEKYKVGTANVDGISGKEDNTQEIPRDIYTRHEYLLSGNSSFKRTIGKSNDSIVYESLYVKE